ncbi:MAG TPA: Smr/MutS family protein [Usitatibacter sp.]|nr:Smr/MutS family protein [Usitatibacter sp.]
MSQARGTRREARDDEFREAVRDVAPIAPTNRVEPWRAPAPPIPHKRNEDERAVLEELARSTFDDEAEVEDDGSYLRPGLPRDILRKLRRTHWVVQDEIDLHGLTADEAALETAAFMADCRKRGLRCVRVVHGKGLRSPGREPVLKRRVRRLLARRDDVIAFVEPRAAHGGGGAVVVLLQA